MQFPFPAHIEIPILQELAASGGSDNIRFIYDRLPSYFPELQLGSDTNFNQNKNWRRAVQKAGRQLEEQNLIRRKLGIWTLTVRGRQTVEDENAGINIFKSETKRLQHNEIQNMLAEIGRNLGYFTVTEFEYYDVVWRETEKSPRLSHIFEVQSKGNIDSAFAKLKRGYHNQRSHPFLIIADESDVRRARKSLDAEFSDLSQILKIFSFAQIEKVYQNLNQIADMLPFLLDK